MNSISASEAQRKIYSGIGTKEKLLYYKFFDLL